MSSTRLQPVKDADGAIEGHVAVIRDNSAAERLNTLLESIVALERDEEGVSAHALERFLGVGTQYFGLEAGMLTRFEGGRVRVTHVFDPTYEFTRGQSRELEATFCGSVYESGTVRSYFHAGIEPIATQRCYREMGLEAYIGAPLRKAGATVGTLCFFGYQERDEPFREDDETLIKFLADWLSGFIERREQREELRRLTRELAYSAEKFKTFYRATPAMLQSIDREHRLVEVSDYWLEKMGYSDRSEVIGRPVTDFQPEEGWACRREIIDTFWETGEPISDVPFAFRRKDGSCFEGEVSAVVAGSQLLGREQSLAVIFDVSERNRALRDLEAKNRELEEMSREVQRIADRFKKFYRETPAMLHSIDEDLKLVEVSDFWLQKMGYSDRSEVIGRSIMEFHTPASAALARVNIARFWHEGTPVYNRAYEFLRKDGSVFESELSAIIATPEDAEKKQNLAVIFDVTERNNALRELKRKNIELERLNEELDTFASVASHDLQEPLRKIRKFAEIAEEELGGSASGDGLYALQVMREAAGRMQKLVADLLNYSKTANALLEREHVDLGGVVCQVLDDLCVSIQESGASVTVEALPAVQADPGQMRQLFQNLIENAIRYRHPERRPEVRISAVRHGGRGAAAVTVSDNGTGFSQERAAEIFMPFRRLSSGAAEKGSGLGLTICNRIASRHGWEIEASGEAGKGACFSIRIPERDLTGC
ncbi:MAG: hypothetical protein Kow0032_19040 [Methyloligellaceae bacterium]